MNKFLLASALMIVLMVALSFCFYPLLPDEIATHWNGWGQPDGFSPKAIGLFIMPALVFFVFIGLVIVPRIDPLKKNILEAANEYYAFILVFALFFFALHGFLIAFNLGQQLDIRAVIIPGLAMVIGYSGFLMSKIKRNYFIGIRTPWTLASDTVWIKTHKLAAKFFYIYAVLIFLSTAFSDYFIYAMVLPAVGITTVIFTYSYVEYSIEEKAKAIAKI